jgi:hypothetical protein
LEKKEMCYQIQILSTRQILKMAIIVENQSQGQDANV